MNERDVVGAVRNVRHQAAHPFAALAVLLPIPRALHHFAGIALEQLDLAAGIELLPTALDQPRLVVERVALTGRAGHEQLHDAARLRAMMQAAVEFRARFGRVGEQTLLPEQMHHGDAAQAAAEAPQKLAAINQPRVFGSELYRRLLRGTNMTGLVAHLFRPLLLQHISP
jgi:hypothetical protein